VATKTSCASAAGSTASNIWRALLTSMRVTWRGVSRCTGPATSVTCAPASCAARAIAKTHLAAGQIGDAAHRVDGLEGGAGGDQHPPAREQLGLEVRDQLVAQGRRLEHAAVADLAAGLVAGIGAEHQGTVGAQLRHIALRRRMCPHLAVHRRRHQQRHVCSMALGPRQAQQGQQIVGAALHQPGDEVGAGGGDQDRVGIARQVDVRHVVVRTRIPLIGVDGWLLSACIVTGVMKRQAASVITTCTLAPARTSSRASSAAL
jgi:hypothetical protein